MTQSRTARLQLLWLGITLAVLAWSLPSAAAQPVVAPFTIAVIPDTQIYVQTTAGTAVFQAQFDWIVEQQAVRNIAFVSHVGDAAQNPASVTEWDRIEGVFSALDAAELPYAIAPGNHDIDGAGQAPEYDARFAADRFAQEPWFGGSHSAEGNRSSFQIVEVAGHQLLFIHIRHLQEAYGDVEAVLDWTSGVLDAHPDHLAFVTTHEFTTSDGTVSMPRLEAVLASKCTVAAVFSGHLAGGAGRGTFTDGCGRVVHHVLTNYQFLAGGGQGFLRTLAIDPLTLTATSEVYSPTVNEALTGPAESFTVSLAPLALVVGDATCGRSVDILDALVIAQFAAGLRSEQATCPLGNPLTQLNTAAADTNGDGAVTITDALIIAQCSVGLPNVFCPG